MVPGKWERVKKFLKRVGTNRFVGFNGNLQSGMRHGNQSDKAEQNRKSQRNDLDTGRDLMTVTAAEHTTASITPHSFTSGQMLAGRFRIVRFISSGGMGEVFEAADAELGERVALKTIRPDIASYPSVIERFKQEVRQARAVSHANVCRVYEVFNHVNESGEHVWFLTMELLEGQTLADYLRQHGSIPAKQALPLVEQMVSGLAAAHEHGVVHRDFKSSNVMLVSGAQGNLRAVVTDFGLSLKQLSGHLTPDEAMVGTPRYMAPEQLQGKEVGFAADQYALGVVICEMLTGRYPIRPATSHETRGFLPPGTALSARWEKVIRRCLQLRPEDRFGSVKEVTSALYPARKPKLAWTVAITGLCIFLFAVITVRTRQSGDRVEAAWQLTPDTDLTSRPSLSRDGQTIAYSSDRAQAGNLDIWVQRLPSGTPLRLTSSPAEDVDPNLAPDSSAVVFHSERDGGGIYIVDVAGGKERLLARHGRNPRFAPDGRSVAYWVGDNDTTIASGQIFVLALSDDVPARIASDFADARYPVWSSDGLHILFSGCRERNRPMPACSEWWVTARDGNSVKDTGSVELLRKNNIQVVDLIGGWYGDKVLFSGRQESTTSLWELTIPRTSLRATGKPHQLTSGEARAVAPSLADNRSIAFERFTAALHIWRIEHATDSRKAVLSKVTHDPTVDISPSVSSNGKWLVFARGYTSDRNVWIRSIDNGEEAPFYTAPGDKFSPIVNDSGKVVVLERREKDYPTLLVTTRDQLARPLRAGCSDPSGWFDGERAVFCREGSPSKIEMVEVGTGLATTILGQKDNSFSDATWSPANQYLLFTASANGVNKQIYAVLLSKTEGQPRGSWIPVTSKSDFSFRPRWSGDGKTVFFLSRRDGFSCIWGQHFDAQSGQLVGSTFPVMHYHDPHFSPEVVVDRSLNLSVAGDTVYLNVGEINTSVWVGHLTKKSLVSFLH